MKQLLQDARTGAISIAEVPAPQLLPGCALVRVAASVVSAGTERAASEFAGKGLLQKAVARPDLARDVSHKVRRDGLSAAWSAVNSRLDQPLQLGYSCAGTVVVVADGFTDFQVGDRVACAGAGYANHAEFVCVPRLLLAKIASSNVTFEDAAFATLGAVALHGVRTAQITLGDSVAVIGLGLMGQLTWQILKAAGCKVFGFDVDPRRVAMAERMGGNGFADSAQGFRDICYLGTNGRGADAVLITAETVSNDPIHLAGAIARDRAIVCAVGTVGMEIPRRVFFEKELDFRISRSYGPGRYDTAFEQKGHDYPIGYVRWTETRNMEAFLDLLEAGKVDVRTMTTHSFNVENARSAYEVLRSPSAEPAVGVLINYPDTGLEPTSKVSATSHHSNSSQTTGSLHLGVLGAGLFATGTLLPVIQSVGGAELEGICAATGSRAQHASNKFGFRYCTTNDAELIGDPRINTVLVATRHNLHSRQVKAALVAGKHVFCEKPLCLTQEDLKGIIRAKGTTLLAVGFNRRYAAMAVRLKEFFADAREPLLMHYRVNAGFLGSEHWTQDPEIGGGRILGEVCHFIDLLTFVAGSLPVRVETRALANNGRYSDDNLTLQMGFANGSAGAITYAANGDKSYSKERLEVFGAGKVGVLQDFRHLELSRDGRNQRERSRLKQDKGHRACWEAFLGAVKNGTPSLVPFEENIAVSLTTLLALQSRNLGEPRNVDTASFISDAHSEGSPQL